MASKPKKKVSLNPFDEEEEQEKEAREVKINPSVDFRSVAASVTSPKGGSSGYEPVSRFSHYTAVVQERLYLWAGWRKGFPEVHTSVEKTKLSSNMDVFNFKRGEWEQLETFGDPPLGVRSYACCTTLDNNIYYFGGYCGHNWCRHCSLHRFDTMTMQWSEVAVANAHQSPMKKSSCGMASFSDGSEDYLFVFGGSGMLCSANQPEAIYIPFKKDPDYGWTNEAHIFSLKTGQWITPSVIGERPPPCAGFTLTRINKSSCLLYGGIDSTTGECLTNAYIVELNKDSIHWHKLPTVPNQPKPANRHDHASVCISGPLYGHIKPTVLISGGRDSQWKTLADMWLLDCSSGSWKQLEVPQAVVNRQFHSMSVFAVSNHCMYCVIFGGVKEWLQETPTNEQPMIADTTLLEICQSDDNEWKVSAVLDTKMLTETEEYKTRLIQQLFHDISTGATSSSDSDNLQQEIIELRSQLETEQTKHRETQAKANSLFQELENIRSQQTSTHSINEPPASANGRLINAEQIAIETTSDALKPFLIKRDDFNLTGPDLDNGAYGRTANAQYKGSLQVTAKILNVPQLSKMNDYSRVVLNHKLIQSFNIRHPNIVQLLFASTDREIVLVTEAAPTTLRNEFQRKSFPKQEVVHISQDIASALHYLHTQSPYPIVHGGISSTSIILEPLALKWRAKIMDFFTSNFFFYTTPESPFVNDPVYRPPLSSSDSCRLTPDLDIFGFGIVVMETILRKLPPTDVSVREQQLSGIKWPAIVNIVKRCTAVQAGNSSSSMPSANDILTELRRF